MDGVNAILESSFIPM